MHHQLALNLAMQDLFDGNKTLKNLNNSQFKLREKIPLKILLFKLNDERICLPWISYKTAFRPPVKMKSLDVVAFV